MRRAVIVGTLVAIVLVGCGGDDGSRKDGAGTDQSQEGSVQVVAEDIHFADKSYATDAGTVTVSYHNDGSLTHTLLIEDVDGFKLEVTSNGDDDEGAVKLDPGTYTLYCDVPGHRDAGMEATLEIG
jgi:plastocyanin